MQPTHWALVGAIVIATGVCLFAIGVSLIITCRLFDLVVTELREARFETRETLASLIAKGGQ